MTAARVKSHAVRSAIATGVLSVVVAALLAACTPSPDASGGTPAASGAAVVGATLTPIEGGGSPLDAAAVPLGDYGYTETEWRVDGEASRYRGAVTGALEAAEVVDGGHPYETRVLVRTPDAAHFNGTLLVEWANVTLGQDVDFVWAEAYEHIMDAGYAYALVSAQTVGVEQVKKWSPERYSGLTVSADNTDPVGGGDLDVCGDDVCAAADPLAWDIYAQTTKALMDAGVTAGLSVQNVVAMGESQSAERLTTYYNTVQPLHGLFQGFVFLDRAFELRDDLEVPAVSVDSEAWSRVLPAFTSGDYVRRWEVAGASHASLAGATYVDGMVLRDQSIVGPDGPLSLTQAIGDCADTPYWSAVDVGLVLAAAIDATVKWAADGVAAPATRQFDRAADGSLVTDAEGAAVGGVRLPDVAAPLLRNVAGNEGEGFCYLVGSHHPLTADDLASRYTDAAGYAAAVRDVTGPLVADGYLLPDDAERLDAEAAAQTIG